MEFIQLKKSVAISESGFIFHPGSGESFSVNNSGLEIIEMLRNEMSNEEIILSLSEKYDIEKSELEKYFFDFVSMLKQYHLIQDNE
jgi:PqqD family protein of HPr-rel-A system